MAVDLEKVVVTFRDVEDVDRATVRVVAPPTASAFDQSAVHRLGDVLAATNVGQLDRESARRAWISPDAVRFHAAGQVGPEWADRLAARCVETQAHGGPPSLEAGVAWPGE